MGDLGCFDSVDNFSAHPLVHQGHEERKPKVTYSIEQKLAFQIAAVREPVVTFNHVDFMAVPPWNLVRSAALFVT